jgi:NAD(P)-dependent dehydrogenase (short-subunit alcohol dehydrogenase family)
MKTTDISQKPKYTPPFTKSQDHPPGIENQLEPEPVYMTDDYIGSKKLAGKKALITGGDSGIGRSVAVMFAREGADVFITHLPEEKEDAIKTLAEIRAEGQKAFSMALDLEDEKSIENLVSQVKKDLGEFDILVNNAAFQNHVDSIEDLQVKQFEKTFNTNIIGMFKVTKALLPLLREGSNIINTASILAYVGDDSLIDYSATKGAIRSFTKSLAKQLSQRKIRVNAVAPGPVWTPLNPAERSEKEIKDFGENTSFGRPAQPVEIAPAYVYLASEITGSYVTGETINIFGSPSGAN